jgi:hypothetical protein
VSKLSPRKILSGIQFLTMSEFFMGFDLGQTSRSIWASSADQSQQGDNAPYACMENCSHKMCSNKGSSILTKKSLKISALEKVLIKIVLP